MLALVAAAGGEIYRIGFFADDFHFLDIARRIPLLNALGGQYGIYPWYRPFSREAYFAVVAACGPFASVVARTLSLAAMGGCAALIDRVGGPIAGVRAARFAAVLFITYGFTRFLTAWASGFQDMLALFLTLLALDAHQRGLRARALVWAALAGVMAGVVGLHLLVRTSWTGSGSNAQIVRAPTELLAALGVALREFVGRGPVLEPLSVALAMLAALAAAFWIASLRPVASGDASRLASPSAPRGLAPAQPEQRLQLATSLNEMGNPPLARAEIVKLEKDVRGTPLETTVHNQIVALDLAGAGKPQGPPHRALGRPAGP